MCWPSHWMRVEQSFPRMTRSNPLFLFTNILIQLLLFLYMQSSERVIEIANDILAQANEKYGEELVCGDWLTITSILIYNVAEWVSKSCECPIEETINAIFAGTITLDAVHREEEE